MSTKPPADDCTSMTLVVTDCGHEGFEVEAGVARAEGLAFRVEQCAPADLVQRCGDADGLLVEFAGISAAVMDALPRVRVVSRYGVGLDNVDVAAATARGIAVCNVPDYGVEAVSDHAIGLTLAVARGIATLDRRVRAGQWRNLADVQPQYELRGRVFGIIGISRIGLATARKAAGLGYEVIGCDTVATPGTVYRGVPAVTLDELLARAQVISMHVPLLDSTRGLIGAAQLAAMGPDAILINTARGGIIDTDALVDALAAHRIAGAGIDCHETEPLPPDHPLTRLDNVVLTPHMAWYTVQSYTELNRRTAQNAADILKGRVPRNLVNPDVVPRLNLT